MTDDELYLATPNSTQLNDMEHLVNEAVELNKQVDKIKKQLDEKTKELHRVTRGQIPDMMASCGISHFTTSKGLRVSIKDVIDGSLPKEDEEKRKAALNWLMNHDGSGIISGEIVIPFSKGQHNYKEEIKTALERIAADYFESEEVHHMSLKAFARERIRNGEEVPLQLLGLRALRFAQISGIDEDK